MPTLLVRQGDEAKVGLLVPLADGSNALLEAVAIVDPSGNVTGSFFALAANFARPADVTAYAAGDRIANAIAAAAVLEIPNAALVTGQAVSIRRARVRKTSVTLANAQFRVHIFHKLPTVNVNDNGVFNAANVLALADIDGYAGSIDVTVDRAAVIGSRGSGAVGTGTEITTVPAGPVGHETSLYIVLEALAPYVPTSAESFYVTLEGVRG